MPDPVRERWSPWMRQALAEAHDAVAHGDVPVGAVLLAPDGELLASAHNEREMTGDPTAHAEVLAIRRAAAALAERTAGPAGAAPGGGWRLAGCTLVVTLEPCAMCAGAVVQSRVDRVVYGARDEKAGAAGSQWDLLRDRRLNHRPEVVPGVLERDCADVLSRFFRTA